MSEQQRVIWFDRLRMSDVERVGGKNASLGEMIGQLAGVGHPGSRRIRHDCLRLPRVPSRGRTRPAYRGQRSPGSTSRTCAALARVGAKIRKSIGAAKLPPALEDEVKTAYARLSADTPDTARRGALIGHGRRPARCIVRRTAGNIPQYQWLRQHSSCDKGGLRLALQRPGDRLSRAQGLRACARSRCRPASSAWFAATPARPACMFTLDTESGFDQVVFITASLWPGRNGGAGRGQPGRVLRLQAEPRSGSPGDSSQDPRRPRRPR